MAILTLHHWPDKGSGPSRAAARDEGAHRDPDLRPGIPAMADRLSSRACGPRRGADARHGQLWALAGSRLDHDRGGAARLHRRLLYAHWRRPAAHLDPRIRSGASSFWGARDVDAGLVRLREDLEIWGGSGGMRRCWTWRNTMRGIGWWCRRAPLLRLEDRRMPTSPILEVLVLSSACGLAASRRLPDALLGAGLA